MNPEINIGTKEHYVKRILIAVAICSVLIACKAQQDVPVAQSESSTSEVHDVTALPVPAPGEAFKAPLPQGVVLQQPYNARMDIAQTNPNGSIGRRTEFEFLEGDASQAMAKFAVSMAAAGFASSDGPADEGGVIRQVFKKPGYGTVFVRAQEESAAKHKDARARGFLVAAWPSDSSSVSIATE